MPPYVEYYDEGRWQTGVASSGSASSSSSEHFITPGEIDWSAIVHASLAQLDAVAQSEWSDWSNAFHASLVRVERGLDWSAGWLSGVLEQGVLEAMHYRERVGKYVRDNVDPALLDTLTSTPVGIILSVAVLFGIFSSLACALRYRKPRTSTSVVKRTSKATSSTNGNSIYKGSKASRTSEKRLTKNMYASEDESTRLSTHSHKPRKDLSKGESVTSTTSSRSAGRESVPRTLTAPKRVSRQHAGSGCYMIVTDEDDILVVTAFDYLSATARGVPIAYCSVEVTRSKPLVSLAGKRDQWLKLLQKLFATAIADCKCDKIILLPNTALGLRPKLQWKRKVNDEVVTVQTGEPWIVKDDEVKAISVVAELHDGDSTPARYQAVKKRRFNCFNNAGGAYC